MSKGNLFLGFGRGKVGDVVFYRSAGNQITRARNRAPRNPRTTIQMLQRVIQSTVAGAYSQMQSIVDHSFEGYVGAAANQQQFMKKNVAALRSYVDSAVPGWQNDPSLLLSADLAYYFRPKNATERVVGRFVISEGSLPTVPVSSRLNGASGLGIPLSSTAIDQTLTYAQLCDALNAQAGDQLTICWLETEVYGAIAYSTGPATEFRFMRIILEPADGDMSKPFLTFGEGGATAEINDPNSKNRVPNDVEFNYGAGLGDDGSSYGLTFVTRVAAINVIPAAILSRWSSNRWLRSTAAFAFSRMPDASAPASIKVYSLGNAIASHYSDDNSTLYLNQAEH